jgi:hypothetical protein
MSAAGRSSGIGAGSMLAAARLDHPGARCRRGVGDAVGVEYVQAMALRNAYAIDMLAPDTLTRRRERIAGIHGLSIDTIELYERNMIDELALRLVHGELPIGS